MTRALHHERMLARGLAADGLRFDPARCTATIHVAAGRAVVVGGGPGPYSGPRPGAYNPPGFLELTVTRERGSITWTGEEVAHAFREIDDDLWGVILE